LVLAIFIALLVFSISKSGLGIELAVVVSVLSGIIFTASSWFFLSLVLRSYRVIDENSQIPATAQCETIQLPISVESARDRVIDALNRLGARGVRVVKSSLSSIVIRGRISISWRSLGEIVYVDITAANRDSANINVMSRPLLPTTLIDYGKNAENAQAIVSLLSSAPSIAL
jgi:hypothetical protein